jgi:hypothetical protein
VLANDREVVARLQSTAFDQRRELLVTAGDWQAFGDQRPTAAAATDATLQFVRDDASHIQLAVHGSTGGFLVLADTFMSGWEAFVNDAPAPILRADSFLRAVPIPEGDCVVRFRYTPPKFWLGAIVSLVAAGLWLGQWWRARHDSRSATRNDPIPPTD